jgi:hypothetical protein
MIEIRHTHTDGTLIEGSAKGDGVWELLKGLRDNWRYFPSISAIGLGQSRDKNAQTWKIDRAAEALRAAGHEVTVTVDESERRDFAAAEAERYERAEDRAERMAGYADNAAARSESAYQRAHQMADAIPFGQPILTGHHSEGRHRRDLARIHSLQGKSIDEGKKADHYAHRADNAATLQASRESIPVTLRRIGKLEADERRIMRDIAGEPAPNNWRERYYAPDRKPATGETLARLESSLADVRDQIAHWRGIVAQAEADGVKVWSAADFAKGDYVQMRGSGRWYLIERVNAKSLSVPSGTNSHALTVVTRANVRHAMGPSAWTSKVPYDEVAGRKSAAEIADLIAAAS